MGDRRSPFGPLFGHNGGGPGYNASVFCAPALRGRRVTVCALCASEEDAAAEDLVRGVFARLEQQL
jgi:D-alanyl-D-alanine carboxypeptidase